MLGSHAIDAICGAGDGKPLAGLDDLLSCARAHAQGD
jgi:hypothetical protein